MTLGPAVGDAADWYVAQVLAQIPRVLTLIDRDPTSPTYGCCDRNYWHYRTQDFPSGMYQELALPLAQVWSLDLPGNPWRGEPRMRELAVAAVRFAARSAHPDGSCDDYYPFERALGSTAFAAAACAGALTLLDERAPDLVAFTRKRAWWLLRRHETGRLSNHQALVALAAVRAHAVCGDETLLGAARERLDLCLSWQHAEGWFAEYEGADAGYQTLTLAFLAAVAETLPTTGIEAALGRAVEFAAMFLHPDGSFGGETGSRNTCQVLPSGFERLAARFPAARHLAEGWLRGAMEGRRGFPDDDRIFSHWLRDYVEAWQARRARVASARSAPGPRSAGLDAGTWAAPSGRTSFAAARLHVIREERLHLVVATGKGGVFRAYRDAELLRNDTGLIAVTEAGLRLSTHFPDPGCVETWEAQAVVIRGRFHEAPRRLAGPMKQVIFRLVNGTVGRFAPNLLRALLQKVLITGRKPAPFTLERRIAWEPSGSVTITDTVIAEPSAPRLARIYASTDATSMYVATSNLWQQASLETWEELPALAAAIAASGTGRSVRSYG